MGICYTYLLYDDFDWDYDRKKSTVIKDLKKELPVAEVIAQWPHYIVVDLDKNGPYRDSILQTLRKYCDSAYVYGDSSPWDLEKVYFPPSLEEQTVIENDHRLKPLRDAAYNDWLERYKQEVVYH